jgi:RNA polymerase sigma factor (sigma-70 family)
MTKQEETKLALAAGNGDRDALDVLIKGRIGMVRKNIRALYPTFPNHWDDMEQCLWQSLIKSIHTFKGLSSFGTWFHAVSYKTFADYWRRYKRRDIDTVEIDKCSNILTYDDNYDNLDITDMIRSLSQFHQALILLRLAGYDLRTISNMYGKEYEAIRSQWRRSVAKLRKRYEAEMSRI